MKYFWHVIFKQNICAISFVCMWSVRGYCQQQKKNEINKTTLNRLQYEKETKEEDKSF